jgi:hypothetical protein
MRTPAPFAFGQVVGALVIGVIGGSLVGGTAIITFAVGMTLGALASAMVCRWWPGYDAAGWRLWLTGGVANPLLIVALGFSIDSYECFLGTRTGWACVFADIGPMVAGICMIPPLFGVALRWLWNGPPDIRPTQPPPRSGGPGSSPRPR